MTDLSKYILLALPWLLFLGLGLTMARLAYQAWQEQALLEALVIKWQKEKALSEQKQSFVRLSSHYLRTPLTLISNGIESMPLLGVEPKQTEPLKQIGQRLGLGVNGLLEQGTANPVPLNQKPKPKSLLASVYYLIAALVGGFIAISLAIYLLSNLSSALVKHNSLLLVGVLMLLAAAVIYTAKRSNNIRKAAAKQYEDLLSQQKKLDKQRNELVKGSLTALRQPLGELKTALRAIKNSKALGPVVKGVNDFESVLRQFVILLSLESGTLSTVKQTISLEQLVDKVAEHYRPLIQEKGLNIKIQLEANSFNQDPLLLEFVLDTLVNNAVRYSFNGRSIDIISRRRDAYVDIFVRDRGQGIAGGKLTNLFKPFSRVEDVEKDFGRQGLGLSLYLDKMVLQYLGGGIKASSAKNQGTTMMLRLPVT